jgi:hypothetical protein
MPEKGTSGSGSGLEENIVAVESTPARMNVRTLRLIFIGGGGIARHDEFGRILLLLVTKRSSEESRIPRLTAYAGCGHKKYSRIGMKRSRPCKSPSHDLLRIGLIYDNIGQGRERRYAPRTATGVRRSCACEQVSKRSRREGEALSQAPSNHITRALKTPLLVDTENPKVRGYRP